MKDKTLVSKILKSALIVIFCAIILIPMVLFNFKKDAISEIDNRKLAESPFTKKDGEFTKNLTDYVSDRIGLRNDMITFNTIFNDKIFNEMSHPNYSYGKNGYVFGAGISIDAPFWNLHRYFAKMVKAIQDYCEQRNVPFVFVFNPAKPAVYKEYIASGINYHREWVDQFLAELDAYDVNYVDNTVELINQKKAGNRVFNVKYDANHWNSLGAYYGTKSALLNLQQFLPKIQICSLDNMNRTLETFKYLPNSKFPINESAYWYSPKDLQVTDVTSTYKTEIQLHNSYRHFGYFVNDDAKALGAPKALVFQGSYMNVYGMQFFQNAFSEYISVHDYQNVMNFPYYFNIFKPECVVFEVAEYTFNQTYFDYEVLKRFSVNPTLDSLTATEQAKLITSTDFTVQQGESLTEITFKPSTNLKYAWLKLGDEYDFIKKSNSYYLTVTNEVYELYKDQAVVVALKN